MKLTKIVSVLLIAFVAFSCSDDDNNKIDYEALKAKEQEQLQAYLKSNNVTVAPTASGLYYIKLEDGDGTKPASGEKVKVNYKGTFLSGVLFDKGAFEYSVGEPGLIAGFIEAVQLVEFGEKAKFIIPSALAYGKYGNRSIPPYSTLIFEIDIEKIGN